MRTSLKLILTGLFFLTTATIGWCQIHQTTLHIIEDKTTFKYGYVNAKGDTLIPPGKYEMCFTEQFDQLAIVLVKGKGIVGIDRNENILFKVYIFDNGPDYPSDGLFRIVKNGKIGYANLKGQTVITPKYDCAYPFKKGKAEVGIGCQTKSDGEYHYWVEGHWYTINKRGQVVKKQRQKVT
jgi:hypothetical protein